MPTSVTIAARERVRDQRRRQGDARVRTGDNLGSTPTEVGATVDERPERGPERRLGVTLRRGDRNGASVVGRRGRSSERRSSGKREANCRDGDKANLLQHVSISL
jgi:hypothetical protein